jgi:hypothetical protein
VVVKADDASDQGTIKPDTKEPKIVDGRRLLPSITDSPIEAVIRAYNPRKEHKGMVSIVADVSNYMDVGPNESMGDLKKLVDTKWGITLADRLLSVLLIRGYVPSYDIEGITLHYRDSGNQELIATGTNPVGKMIHIYLDNSQPTTPRYWGMGGKGKGRVN